MVFMFENKLEVVFDEFIVLFLDVVVFDIWLVISRLMEVEVKDVIFRLLDVIVGFELFKEEEMKMCDFLLKFGWGVVEKKSKEEVF